MNIVQVEENLKKITTKFSKDTFVFDLMTAYDFPKSTISKLKIKNKKHDDLVVPGKLHFVGVSKKELDSKFAELVKEYSTVKKVPRFIIVTDYQDLKAYDTKVAEKLDTEIKNLSKHPDFFLPWVGIEKKVFQGENPADVKAAEKLAKFFDLILKDNLKLVEKNRHALNVFLTRILFCFFAEDTDIFKKGLFTESLASHTKADGGDLDDYLQRLFEVLNKKSRTGLPDFLKEFPYVNGGLFAEEFPIPKFSKKSRESLIDLGSDLNWAEINPDIFGSMIQAVVHPDQRAGLGMHYTSVTNIMKVIEPLFLTELKEEVASAKGNKSKLKKLLERIGYIKIFDPACGSGNFLIIAYKELRLLEMDILRALGEIPMSGISLSNFYGIEIDDFAHEVAKLSLWLAEHQMDVLFNKQFGDVKASLPLKDSGRIVCGNATRLDWEKVCSSKKTDEVYILGNPPYLGSSNLSESQKEDVFAAMEGIKEYKKLDYICCWLLIASKYVTGRENAAFAFVSTNSICQGEQVTPFWPVILSSLEIFFAHKSFRWSNMAKDKAAVYCIIVGIRLKRRSDKHLYFDNGSYLKCEHINAYLLPTEDIYVQKRSKPFGELPPMINGSKPADGGNLILSDTEAKKLVSEYPELREYVKKFVGAEDYLQGKIRYCLWFDKKNAEKFKNIPEIKKRFDSVKKMRLASQKEATRRDADRFYEFAEPRFIGKPSIIIPRVSSERRAYIPFGFLNNQTVIADSAQMIPDAEAWVLGLISSKMHMAWVKVVAGRLKTDFRYSAELCYNSFPIKTLTEREKSELTSLSLEVLKARESCSDMKIGDLYNKMPEQLENVHKHLDDYVDRLYRSKPFENDDERAIFLFNLYQTIIAKGKIK